VRAWQEFTADPQADSLRAVERCRQHPGKMWVVQGRRMTPLLPFTNGPHPWHSSQYQALPEIHVQNASLEIAWTRVVRETRTIAGRVVMPFFTQGSEGLDVNTAEDWTYAERLVSEGLAPLPDVRIAALP
jgi:CMP-N,N'-diacetyllegionaminic acid synthase